ncbi:NAD-dependent protein deacetylase [Pseudidiomarina insulisalsae]|uniref:protein acetyllysine N-acetyltransferase n=1 Tax=Pseudidiomarina insulisalsae TaxID=575789 RepID=A0A432YI44_9GAMM|nr:NAD-dependent protein deacetylase [Pseudidiomarina insulisalsae]RUO60631.1 NAD-dependent protein deacetylase [Pseudidiomarina insulisalsae]
MIFNQVADAAAALQNFLITRQPVTLLTGAGLSTDSGIPDYRDAHGQWKRNPPMQHHEFMGDSELRKRYWGRSLHGWPTLYHAQPNAAHYAIAALQRQGLIDTIITQNVDGLHQRAGSDRVINLHGYANDMICMSCCAHSQRLDMHERCLAANPDFKVSRLAEETHVAPDGDADIEVDFSSFVVPECLYCGGILKPDVVYFGDNVPRPRVEQAQQALRDSNALLVVGSSLMVFSGFRFARQASAENQPIALLTRGTTRADQLASLKLDTDISATLQALSI